MNFALCKNILTPKIDFLNVSYDRAVEQLVARWAHNPKVAGSNPARANFGEVAQLVRAHGSYPWCGGFESLPR